MNQTATNKTSEVTGIVRCANERGIKLDGAENWLNLSRWATVDSLPARGETVSVIVDGAGFLRDWQLVFPTTLQAAQSAPTAAIAAPDKERPNKDQQIARMHAITSALALAPIGSDPEAVCEIAAVFEAWTMRPA